MCHFIIIKNRNKEKAVIKKESIIWKTGRLYKHICRNFSFCCIHCGKQIKTSFYKLYIVKSDIICKCLKTQISNPQTSASFTPQPFNFFSSLARSTILFGTTFVLKISGRFFLIFLKGLHYD